MSANEAAKTSNKVPIAIIGLSGIIGKCENVLEIWDSLYNENNKIHDLSDIRKQRIIKYLKAIYKEYDIDENCFVKGCVFDNPFVFDNQFFNIDLENSKYLNPSIRKMLEIAYKAFENAGLTVSALKYSNTGVYVGYSSDIDEQFLQIIKTLEPDKTYQGIYGNIRCRISNYISHYFNLKGPSLMIDTSSSSGLVSLYTAVKALQNNECDVAFVGSAKINCIPYISNTMSDKIKKYFSFSKIRAFDNKANGMTYGEGAVGFVLKPLNKAIKDNDFIHAVVYGGAINYNFALSDNAKFNKNSKRDLMLKALKNSEVSATEISYVEADGIGIKKEDCTEISAMSEAFSQSTNNKQFCCVGSVKTNFGHTGSVSGLIGMMKVILAMQKNIIPANLNFRMPNKDIDFINSPFYVNNKKTTWNSDVGDVYAAVNSYGWAGTNCCIILKNFSYMKTLFNISGQQQLFVISAKNEHSLLKLCLLYSKICSSIDYDYDDFVNTLCFKREHFNYRFATIFSNYEELSQILLDFVESKNKYNVPKTYYGVIKDDKCKTKLIGVKPLEELARHYIDGCNITKKNIKLTSYKTVNLPAYEFLQTDCYLNCSDSLYNKRKKYDLINGYVIKSKNEILYKTNISCKKFWEIRTCFIKGINSLSLGSLFEIILQAINPKNIITFSNIIIDKDFFINDNNEKELIIIDKNKKISLESENKNNWQTHLSCNYQYEQKTILPKLILQSNLCENIYINYNAKLLEYITLGQRWHSCETVGKVNNDNSEFLISLCLNEKYKNEVENYYIYPVLFDIAINIILYCTDKAEFVKPCSIDSITIYKNNLPSKINVHIVRTNDILSKTDFTYNIDIYDTYEKIYISIKNYHLKSFIQPKRLYNKFTSYITLYNEVKLSENKKDAGYRILFFGDESNRSLRCSEEISKKGHRVFFVNRRQSMETINNYINVKNFDFIIVSCFNEKTDNLGHNHFSYINIMEFNFLKIISKLEAIKNKKIAYLLNGSIAINNSDGIISPEYSGIRAMVTAFAKENPHVNIRCYDIDLNSCINIIINELVNGNKKSLIFRKNRIYYEFQKKSYLCKTHTTTIYDNHKTIIIVGYDGKSEILFANHLKEKGFNNIVIFSYSELSQESTKNFTTFTIDIIKQDDIIKAIEKVHNSFGDIVGVIVLSDAIAFGNLKDKSLQLFQHVFDVKATVINNMHVATLNDKLDFFVTFSNINTSENLPGFSDFAAANAVVEAFSIYRNQLGYNSVNICLPSMQYSQEDEILKSNCIKQKFLPINYKDVFDVFDKVVFGNNINPVVIYGNEIENDLQDYKF